MAVVKFYSWNWSDAEQEFKRALELNPSYAPAYSWYAIYSAARGRIGEAIARIYRAQELDPLSPHISQNVGWVLHMARQYDEEIEQYQRTFELDPNFLFARIRLGGAYLEKRMFSEALIEYENAATLSNKNPATLGALGRAYALAGDKHRARQLLEELKGMRERRYVNPQIIALIYLGLGETERFFEWMEKAYRDRSYAMIFLRTGPQFDHVRADPRFTEMLQRVGLSP